MKAALLTISLFMLLEVAVAECDRTLVRRSSGSVFTSDENGVTDFNKRRRYLSRVYASADQLESVPAWQPGSKEPPVSVNEAIELAMAAATKRQSDAKFSRFALDQHRCDTTLWYYYVRYYPLHNVTGNSPADYLVVLMNEIVLFPEFEDAS